MFENLPIESTKINLDFSNFWEMDNENWEWEFSKQNWESRMRGEFSLRLLISRSEWESEVHVQAGSIGFRTWARFKVCSLYKGRRMSTYFYVKSERIPGVVAEWREFKPHFVCKYSFFPSKPSVTLELWAILTSWTREKEQGKQKYWKRSNHLHDRRFDIFYIEELRFNQAQKLIHLLLSGSN